MDASNYTASSYELCSHFPLFSHSAQVKHFCMLEKKTVTHIYKLTVQWNQKQVHGRVRAEPSKQDVCSHSSPVV